MFSLLHQGHSLLPGVSAFWWAEWRGLKEINLRGRLAVSKLLSEPPKTQWYEVYICSGWKVLENSQIHLIQKTGDHCC